MSITTAPHTPSDQQEQVERRPSADGGALSRAQLSIGVLLALGVGVGVGLGDIPVVVALVAMLVAAAVCFRTERGLLHLLALAPFVESLTVGPVTIGRLLSLMVVVVLTAKLVTGRLHLPSFPASTWLPAGGFVLLIVASGLWASDRAGWVFAMGQVGLALAFFTAFALLMTAADQVRPLLVTYSLGALVAAFLGGYEALADVRADGLQGDANIYGMYQVAALAAIVALVRTSHGWTRAGWLATMVPIAVSILLSQSRGAFIAFVVTALLVAALDARRRVLIPLAVVLGVAGGIAATLLDDRYSVTRVSSDRASGRIDIWYVAWHAFLDQPWTGLGAGGFVSQSIERLTTVPGVELIESHLLVGQGIEVHNIYLEALAERGVFGLLTLLAFLVVLAWNLARAARRFRQAAITALLPMLLAYCSASVFLSVANSKLLWMLAGIAAALIALRSRDTGPAGDAETATSDPTAVLPPPPGTVARHHSPDTPLSAPADPDRGALAEHR